MLHSCRTALFYCLLFNSSLSSLEFKFELNLFGSFTKENAKPISFSPFSFGPAQVSFSFPLFFPAAQTGPNFLSRRPIYLSRPRSAPPSLPPTGGPHLLGSSSFPVGDTDSRSPAATRPAPPFPSWPARQGILVRPYKGCRDLPWTPPLTRAALIPRNPSCRHWSPRTRCRLRSAAPPLPRRV